MKNEKSISLEVTPDPSLFGKLGARSKALPNVVTELVDNSLDSWTLMPSSYKRGKILEVRIVAGSTEGSMFTVSDNAGGMTLDELQGALTIAQSNKGELEKSGKKLLGFYGFGLKSAAMFIGDEFTIYSQSYTEKNLIHYVSFNREKFEDPNSKTKWMLEFKTMSADAAAKMEVYFPDGHGTIIKIKNKRYRPASRYGIVERLQRTFAPRLPCDPRLKSANEKFSYEPIHLYFITRESQASKAEPLQALGPFYTFWNNDKREVQEYYQSRLRKLNRTKNKDERDPIVRELIDTDALKGRLPDGKINPNEAVLPKLDWIKEIPATMEIKEVMIAGKRVRGRVGILDRGMVHTSEYGFDLIKNGRVIETSVKDPEKKKEQFIGLVANNHNGRIVGQLFLDDWPTDHQKTEFIKEEAGWSKQEDKKSPEGIADIVLKFIRDKHFLTTSQNLQSPGKTIPGEESAEEIEEKVISEKVNEAAPSIVTSFSRAVKSTTVGDQLTRMEKLAPEARKKELHNLEEKKATANSKLQLTKPEITWEKKGSSASLYLVKFIEEKNVRRLKVILNLDHPFLKRRESGQLKVVGEFLVAEAFASYMAQEKLILGPGYERFVSLRDGLLRDST